MQRSVLLNKHLERESLHRARELAGLLDFDVAFLAGYRLAEIEAAGRLPGRGGTMTVAGRRHLESLRTKAREQVTEARTFIREQWGALAEKQPVTTKVVECAGRVSRALEDVHETFRSLLDLAPRSASITSEYATFLREVANDTSRGRALQVGRIVSLTCLIVPHMSVYMLQAEASSLEEHTAKERSIVSAVQDMVFGAPRDFDVAADSVAYFTVSSEVGQHGKIIDANEAALALFGFPRHEFVGQDHSIIIPSVIGNAHHSQIANFAKDGIVRVTQNSRLIYGAKRDGTLIPIVANILSMDGCLGFACDTVSVPQSFIWFGGEEQVRSLGVAPTMRIHLRRFCVWPLCRTG